MYLAHLLPDLVPELARGVSTALAVWATPSCPQCPSLTCTPSLHCPAATSCPACVCQGSERSCPASVETPRALIFLLGILCGVILTLLVFVIAPFLIHSCYKRVKGSFLHFLARPKAASIVQPLGRSSAAQIALARRQPALETF